MDAPLMFEILLYLNGYYFGIFAGGELLIAFAKFNGPILTPNIHIDGAIICAVLLVELIKIITFQKFHPTRKGLANFLAISLTFLSILGILYVFVLQDPVLKIETMLCGIALILFLTEFVYGFLQFLPCCKKKQYAE